MTTIACGKCGAGRAALEPLIEILAGVTLQTVRCTLCGWRQSRRAEAEIVRAEPRAKAPVETRAQTKTPQLDSNCLAVGCANLYNAARKRTPWPLCSRHTWRMNAWLKYPHRPQPLIESAPGQWTENPELRRHRRAQAVAAAPPENQEETMTTEPAANACASCRQEITKKQARGLCKPCYQRHMRAGTLEQFPRGEKFAAVALKPSKGPRTPQAPSAAADTILFDDEYRPEPTAPALAAPPIWHEVRVCFAPADEELLERLRSLAARQRRDLPQQILTLVEQALEVSA